MFGCLVVAMCLLSQCPESHCPQRILETQTIHLQGLNITFAKSKRSVNIFLQCRGRRIWFLARNVVPLHCQSMEQREPSSLLEWPSRDRERRSQFERRNLLRPREKIYGPTGEADFSIEMRHERELIINYQLSIIN